MTTSRIHSFPDIETLSRATLLPHDTKLFPGFTRFDLSGAGATIHGVIGGNGPPIFLIHGNPLSHVSWHKIAPSLARDYTVVAVDLRGYGDSSKPAGGDDHSAYSFRSMAEDIVAIAKHFGFTRFPVVGHDRGGRVGFRLALDHPHMVSALIPLDIVPTHHVLSNVSLGWGLEAYHWFFMSQKAPFPEKLLCADLDYYIQSVLSG